MRDFRTFVRDHLAPLALPPERELEIVEELAAGLEESYESLVARGLSDDEAWSELVRQMPDWNTLANDLRDGEPAIVRLARPERGPLAGAGRALASAVGSLAGFGLIRDLRSSVRLLLKARGFTATTILTLAVCLGANVAIFTVVYAVLLRPLPVPDADRIVALGDVYPTITPDDILSNTAPSYFDRLDALTTLEAQAMFTFWYDTFAVDGIPQELRGIRTTPSLFRVLRVQPALGRAFTDAEGEIGADRKIVLSHGLWQRLYGGDPTVLGKAVRLGFTGQPYTIVGVMPRGFSFFDRGDDGHASAMGEQIQFYLPLAFTAAQRSDSARTRYGFYYIGRLRSDATISQLRAQVDALNARNVERFPQFSFGELGMYTAVTPLHDALTRGVRRRLYLLWGAAAFVLLIGGLNIANLSLARSSARARDLVTRLALGASRLRLTRLLIVEGVVLAGIGGAAGIGIAAAILRLLLDSGLAILPNAASIRLDVPVVAAALAVSLVIGVLIGLVPATTLGRLDINQVLADSSRLGTGGRPARVVRRGLAVTQVAVSVILLIGAGLLLTSFRNLLSVDAGFDPERVISATIFPPPSRYADQRAVVALSDRVLESFRSIPGIDAAGLTSNIALSGRTSPATVWAADRPPQPGEAPVLPSVVVVTPGYFEAMSTPLIRGRYFAESDSEHTQRVAIVDERLAARLWPREEAIGKGLQRGDVIVYTVVGVVREVRFEGLDSRADTAGTAYFHHAQAPPAGRLRWIAVKTAGDPDAVMPSLRSALTAIDPDLPLSDIQTMSERTSRSLVSQRLAMGLASLFGVIALLLSVVGVYGVLAYLVARRTREIGIRMALGSSTRRIFRLVFGEGLALVSGGLMLGLLGAVALGRVLEDQVFGVTPTDPAILGAVVVSTGLIALLACVSPARRATRVDPLIVMNGQ